MNMKKRILLIATTLLLLIPTVSFSQTIDVKIKGMDNGVKTSKQQDYEEAVLNAKLQAIERAGVKVNSITKIENFRLKYKKVESEANAVLMPGFNVMDIGYQADGTYLVVLMGKVKSIVENIDNRELRYAKSLVDRGKNDEAQKIVFNLINTSKEDNIVAEAMYLSVIWKFASNEREMLEKLKAYYPDYKKNNYLESLLNKRYVTFIHDGVMWKKEKENGKLKYNEAEIKCSNSNYAGYTDWRLPNRRELLFASDVVRIK